MTFVLSAIMIFIILGLILHYFTSGSDPVPDKPKRVPVTKENFKKNELTIQLSKEICDSISNEILNQKKYAGNTYKFITSKLKFYILTDRVKRSIEKNTGSLCVFSECRLEDIDKNELTTFADALGELVCENYENKFLSFCVTFQSGYRDSYGDNYITPVAILEFKYEEPNQNYEEIKSWD